MPPKTLATPEQVSADLSQSGVNVVNPTTRRNKNPGINRDLGLTKPPTKAALDSEVNSMV